MALAARAASATSCRLSPRTMECTSGVRACWNRRSIARDGAHTARRQAPQLRVRVAPLPSSRRTTTAAALRQGADLRKWLWLLGLLLPPVVDCHPEQWNVLRVCELVGIGDPLLVTALTRLEGRLLN